MRKSILLSLGLMFFMTGCIPSLHPLYTDEDLIFEPSLVGQWADKDGKESWTYTKSGDKEYKLVYVDDKGRKGGFAAHLLKLGDHQFLDLFPADAGSQQNEFYQIHILPAHTFMRIQLKDETLQMAYLDSDWLKKYLQEHPDAVRHDKLENDTIVLTAPPKELQAFLTKHATSPEAWKECDPISRRTAEPERGSGGTDAKACEHELEKPAPPVAAQQPGQTPPVNADQLLAQIEIKVLVQQYEKLETALCETRTQLALAQRGLFDSVKEEPAAKNEGEMKQLQLKKLKARVEVLEQLAAESRERIKDLAARSGQTPKGEPAR